MLGEEDEYELKTATYIVHMIEQNVGWKNGFKALQVSQFYTGFAIKISEDAYAH